MGETVDPDAKRQAMPDHAEAEASYGGESTYQLMQQAHGGSEEAASELCRRLLPRLQRWARGRTPAAARSFVDTDDLVQDVIADTIRRLSRFQYRRHHALQAYVRKALDNRIRDVRRRCRRAPEKTVVSDDLPSAARSPLEHVLGEDLLRRYEAALARLRPIYREAIVARVELGCSYPEIADALDKPSVATARKTVNRAVLRLAEEMRREQ